MPQYQVTDPMYLMVSNLNMAYNAFFRAIPYGGPNVQLLGAQPYDTVSNTITLTASITDLSGTMRSNQAVQLTVNGEPSRSTETGNTFSLDTRYAPSGYQEIELSFVSQSVVFDSGNPPQDLRTEYHVTAALPLDFENSAFLVNASDMCSDQMGTNYITFGLSQPDTITVTITV